MVIEHKNLPSIRILLAFEAVARLGTFTAAARELSVSQAAISQKVRQLESWLGLPLIIRSRPNLKVTDEGLMIADSIRSGLTTVSRALEAARRPGQQNRVALATDNTMALYWIGPRIQTFYAANPDVELSLITSDQVIIDGQTNFDLGLTFAIEPPTKLKSKLLFGDEVVAVASPAYLRTRPENLPPARWNTDILLHTDPEPWLAWREWLHLVGLEVPHQLRADFYSNYVTLMQAVLSGRGLGLGWLALVRPLLQSGDLVQLGDFSVRSPGSYYLVWDSPIGTRSPKGVRVLFDWFMAFVDAET